MTGHHNMPGSSSTSWTENLFKVLVIGDLGVGKSSIVLRYVNKGFNEGYKASIGVDFALKTIEWDPKTVVRIQLWDIAGECHCEKSTLSLLQIKEYCDKELINFNENSKCKTFRLIGTREKY